MTEASSVGVEVHRLICHRNWVLCRGLMFSSHSRCLEMYWCPGRRTLLSLEHFFQVCPSCFACTRSLDGQLPTCRQAQPTRVCNDHHLHTSGSWQTDNYSSTEHTGKSRSVLFFGLSSKLRQLWVINLNMYNIHFSNRSFSLKYWHTQNVDFCISPGGK